MTAGAAGQPRIATLADIEAIEATPLEQRLTGLDSTYDVIRQGAERFGDTPALSFLPDGDPGMAVQTVSYRELLARVTQAANLFGELGIGAGDVVSYALPNLLETHYTIWGGEAAGIVNAVNPMLEAAHIAHILNAVQAKVLVTAGPSANGELWRKIAAIRAEVPSLQTVLLVGEPHDLGPDLLAFGPALARQPAARLLSGRLFKRGDIASCFHTGGTTGLPKVACHTHGNELANACSAGLVCGLTAEDSLLCGLPLFHVNAVLVTGLLPFMYGAHVILLGANGFRQKSALANFWRTVETFRASFFSAVPTVYAALLGVPLGGAKVSTLRYALCGAAAMPPEIIRRFEDGTGVRILEGYGLTEGTCVSAVNPRDGQRHNGSIGLRLPYQELKTAVLEDGLWLRDCAADEIGTLLIRGPNVFPGYREEAANRTIWAAPGWLNTGDLARIDAEGYVWLTGRQKELIIRGGHNIEPAMIEDAMMRHPAVQFAAAVGKPDAYAGELPVVFVVLKPGATAAGDELLAHARAEIPERSAVPVDVFVRDALPTTAVGKTFKPRLRFEVTEIVLSELLHGLAGDRATFEVAVSAHERHGAIVRISGRAGTDQATDLDAMARKAMAGFSLQYELEWTH